MVELVLHGDKPVRAKIDISALPKVLGVSTRWRGYWHSGSQTHYVCTLINCKKVYLHRVVTEAPAGLEVDHIGHDGLDNRRSSLRITNRSENCRNRRLTKNKHGLRGVKFNGKKWEAITKIDGKYTILGRFSTKEEAAAAYDKFFAERLGLEL